jgi:uncharacterized protein YneR
MQPAKAPLSPEQALHTALDRYGDWISLSAGVKLRIRSQGEKIVARGHVLYIAGERYEIGFQKPYNQFIGTFYITPTQLSYFDTHDFPKTFNPEDSVDLSQLIPLVLPNWDPRDLLPFPVSGRTNGFQTDSIVTENGHSLVYGASQDVTYALTLDKENGAVAQELVQRGGRDLMFKRYDKFKMLHGWPVATRVVCTDKTGSVSFTWSLSGIQLRARDFHLPSDSISTFK